LRDGKQRLSAVLEDGQRAALVQWLLAHTLEQATGFPGLSRTLVVTACRDVVDWGSSHGIRVLRQARPDGLNSALREAQEAVAALGGSRMLVVSSDLPFLQTHDLQHLADAAPDGVLAIAPDLTGLGTNAMCLPVARAFDFAFGPDSFSQHCARAQMLGLESAIVRRRGLAFDVDLPVHLSELHQVIAFLPPSHTRP